MVQLTSKISDPSEIAIDAKGSLFVSDKGQPLEKLGDEDEFKLLEMYVYLGQQTTC